MRVILDRNPLAPAFDPAAAAPQADRARPAWIVPRQPEAAPQVLAYRLRFGWPAAATARIHVSADERYELWLDGRRIGRGPERGSEQAWFYESYDLPLAAGQHVLFARVWYLGELAPLAQVSPGPGLLLWSEPPFDVSLSTGAAGWQVMHHAGYSFELTDTRGQGAWFVGANQHIDAAAFPWGIEAGAGDGWQPAVARREDELSMFGHVPLHMLAPATLPAPLSISRRAGTVRFVGDTAWSTSHAAFVAPEAKRDQELPAWQAMADGGPPAVVPPHSHRQVIFDLEQYYCAYPRIVASGGQGSRISVCWAEALHINPGKRAKGQRDVVEGRYFVAPMRDTIQLDGGAQRRFESLWWRAGRYVQLLVETASEPLTIESIELEETRYPLDMESRISADDQRVERIVPLALRALQMCAHETHLDCPYYEQLMYAGDTRLQVLSAYAISRDDRLARKALMLFDLSRLSSGLAQARYPSRIPQIIPPFALWWVAMVHDFGLWRDDRPFLMSLMPGVRAVVDGFLRLLNDQRLLAAPPFWNFVDWVPGWPAGVPPDGASGVSGLLNWHLVYTLGLAQQLEQWAGEAALAQRIARYRQDIADQLVLQFWDDARGLFADDRAHAHFCEHTQSLALLSGLVDDQRRDRIRQQLLEDPTLTRTSLYFAHYLFEAYRLLRHADPLFERLQPWFELPDRGYKTTPEESDPSRSDCHAWSAHPLFHSFATILGIRPASFGFHELEIAPLLGPLRSISGSLVHPRGTIKVQLHSEPGRLRGTIALPDGVTGRLRLPGASHDLRPGSQLVDVPLLGEAAPKAK